mgnify:CR=1 FL=1
MAIGLERTVRGPSPGFDTRGVNQQADTGENLMGYDRARAALKEKFDDR